MKLLVDISPREYESHSSRQVNLCLLKSLMQTGDPHLRNAKESAPSYFLSSSPHLQYFEYIKNPPDVLILAISPPVVASPTPARPDHCTSLVPSHGQAALEPVLISLVFLLTACPSLSPVDFEASDLCFWLKPCCCTSGPPSSVMLPGLRGKDALCSTSGLDTPTDESRHSCSSG